MPYYRNISYNGLPKINVDFFDFEKYESFDELEKNIDFEEVVQEDYNDKNANDLSFLPINNYSQLLDYFKNSRKHYSSIIFDFNTIDTIDI